MGHPGYGVAAVLVAAALLVGCVAEDPAAAAAETICLGIEAEDDALAAYDRYERSVARERRAGLDDGALREALYRRCDVAIAAISAAANDPEVASAPAPDNDDPPGAPDVAPVDLRQVDWGELAWVTRCTESGDIEELTLTPAPMPGRLWHNSADDPDAPELATYTVEAGGVIFGDLTGDGAEEAVFTTDCFLGDDSLHLVEVWSVDPTGQPVHLPPVIAYTRADGVIDGLDVVDGRLRIHTAEPSDVDERPDRDGYGAKVVTDWTYVDGAWRSQEHSRSEPPSELVPECATRTASREAAAVCTSSGS